MSPDKAQKFIRKPFAFQLAVVVAAVSGFFLLVVSILMIANYLQITAMAPLDQPELLALRKQLAETPESDPVLVSQVRALDLLSRKAFFTSQEQLFTGGRLLFGAFIVFLAAVRLAARWNPKPPGPSEGKAPGHYWNRQAVIRELIVFSAMGIMIVASLASLFTPLEVPEIPVDAPAQAGEQVENPPSPGVSFPDWEAMRRQWPTFRGPGGYGVAQFTTAPTEWDGESGKNIRWKVEIAALDFNSPVVWGDAIFMSGATETVREVYCHDAETGALRWKQALPKFPGTPEVSPKISKDTGYAAPTMAVHGSYAYAIFANGDLVCYDFSGNLVWGKNIGVPENHYGHASSLIAWGNLLLVQYDQKKVAKLIALKADTGENAWEAQRKKISWASPICVPMPSGPQLILASEKDVDAYDPVTGKALWSLECLDGEVAPSPAYAAGHVFVANDYAVATAIRLSEEGGAFKAEAAWEWDESLPDISSPVGSDKYFFMATSRGEIICLDIATGESLWIQEFDEGFNASPVLVGDRVYALDKKGVMHIFKDAPAYESLAENAFGDEASATPAFLDKRMYVRTHKYLWCVEAAQ